MSVLGFDLSEHNGMADFNGAYDAGIRFAFIRATMGLSVDGLLDQNIYLSENSAVHRGFYHVFHPNLPAFEQGEHFLNHLPQRYSLPPVVDVELSNNTPPGEIRRKLRELLLYLEVYSGMRPIIYTANWFWEPSLNGTEWASAYSLWIASYINNSFPLIPSDFFDYDFWQFTESADGRKYGVDDSDIDLNRFRGSQKDFDYYIERINSNTPKPRVKYKRSTVVVSPSLNEEQRQEVINDAISRGQTISFSYDHPEWGTVITHIPEESRQIFKNWFERYYPRVKVVFRDIPLI